MEPRAHNPVVHLELHTGNADAARTSYEGLFGWRSARIGVADRSYIGLEVGEALGGGIVECGVARPRWLPYVEVDEISMATALAGELGGAVLLGPREGPTGWRSVIDLPAAGEVGLWQRKPTA
jgi:predicted enzyme related to lactoylglutathione lyase